MAALAFSESRLNQFYLKLWIDVNTHASRQERRNAHVGDWMLRCARLETTAKVRIICDVCVGAELATNCKQRLRQSVAENADVNCALQVEKGDEQPQAVSRNLERVRVCIVVKGRHDSEKRNKLRLIRLEHGMRDDRYRQG
jgi:hypothetical protein